MPVKGIKKVLALVSIYGPPDKHLKDVSMNTLHVCKYRANLALHVIEATEILAHVAMFPF